jgi:hypothetical protein
MSQRTIAPLIALLALLLNMSYPCTSQSKDSTAEGTQIEFATPLPREHGGTLATVEYGPSQNEARFFSSLSADEKTTGGMLSDYGITGKKGTYVGWFGIVRNIVEDTIADRSILLIEMKYHDGYSDSHIMVVSFNGAGDFRATLRGIHSGIKKLSLVKVYGRVTDEVEAIPHISADFLRVWDWGLFTFMSYGDQKGNASWKRLNRIDDIKIYEPFPKTQYYEDRLGARDEH